ncbi:hypothetical protein JCM8097_001405 [Rhodosporidiobolus ruineniae]
MTNVPLSTRDQRVLDTLQEIRDRWPRGLNDFLDALFVSSKARPVTEARAQTLKGGTLPARLIPVWLAAAPSKKARDKVGETVVAAAAEVLSSELARAADRGKEFKVEAVSLSQSTLDVNAGLEGLGELYEARLPRLMGLMKAVMGTQNRWEKEEKEVGELGERKEGRLGPTATAAISMILFHHSHSCNSYQTLLGLFLASCRVSRTVLDVLNRLSLAISYDSTRNAWESLEKDKIAVVRREFAPPPLGKGRPHSVPFDNFGQLFRVSNERGTHSRELVHLGISAVVALDPEVSKEEFSPEVQAEAEQMRGRGNGAKLEELYDEVKELEHLRLTNLYHLRALLIDHFPLAATAASSSSSPNTTTPLDEVARTALRSENEASMASFPCSRYRVGEPRVTERYTLPLINHNVGTTEGVMRWAEDASKMVLGEGNDRTTRPAVHPGDQRSAMLLNTVQRLRQGEARREDRFDHVHSEPLLFHTAMNVEAALLKTYESTCASPASNPGALHHVSIFSRQATLPPDTAHHAEAVNVLETALAGSVLRCAEVVLGVLSYEALRKAKISSFEGISHLAEQIWLFFAGFRGAARRSQVKVNVDEVFTQFQLFLADGLLWRELRRATSYADYGGIWDCLRRLIFFFKGGGNFQYANALLEMRIVHFHELPPALRKIREAAWLVNETGRRDGMAQRFPWEWLG